MRLAEGVNAQAFYPSSAVAIINEKFSLPSVFLKKTRRLNVMRTRVAFDFGIFTLTSDIGLCFNIPVRIWMKMMSLWNCGITAYGARSGLNVEEF